jgi:murein DD-endopeptidase MepM/ murein hydrolase activator NlpD
MQRRIAGLAAVLGMLAFPQSSGSHFMTEGAPAGPQSTSTPWVIQGLPARARTEPLNVLGRARRESTAAESAFPVRGRHDMGTPVNGFGGGRGHQGQDIFAGCGTPVVAARAGKVVEVATEGNEGNYVVMETSDGRQQAYLHLLHPHSVARGERVDAGQRIGSVGQTGNAQGCHLHFELWTAPGRFTGGQVLNPRPALDRWANQGA